MGRGASSTSAVPPEHLAELNAGRGVARPPRQAMVIEQGLLMESALPELPRSMALRVTGAADLGILKKMTLVGTLLHEHFGTEIPDVVLKHSSDTVRGWACFMVGSDESASVEETLARIQPLADDAHFTVREWAWMGVRKRLVADLHESIEQLAHWTQDRSDNVRRFSTEALRPRGVWASHISVLKSEPELGLPLLEPLRSDPSRYVQDSVSNWINDASKTRPDWPGSSAPDGSTKIRAQRRRESSTVHCDRSGPSLVEASPVGDLGGFRGLPQRMVISIYGS